MSFVSIFKKIFLRFCVALAVIMTSGCVYLVVGGVGALGGYVVSPDTVEGELTDYTEEEVWDATIEIISVMGIILEENMNAGILIAKVNNTKITVTVIPMSRSRVKLAVKARKAFFPKIRTAQDIYVKIVNNI